ncbi:MAG: CinA family protein [Bellilinea sp.]
MEEPLESRIGRLLLARQLKLAVAESCTGGLLGHLITNVPGCSEYFLGGITAYSYEAKQSLLGVKSETLIRFGAVSRETVLEMAQGVRRAFAAQVAEENLVGVAISGIAGPGGAQLGKPVGLVWVGLSAAEGDWAADFYGQGNREENKAFSALRALESLQAYLEGSLFAGKQGEK